MHTNLSTNEDTLIVELYNILKQNNKTITTAESCTGGLIASMITKISGSSNIFNGAIVTYSNEIKTQELNVKKETLEKNGAVSVEVVTQMLTGVIKKFHANFAIAISGIAGPNGGTKKKPVGTVVIGIMGKDIGKEIEVCHFNGTREEIQNQAANYSLKKILIFLKKSLDK